MKTIKRLSILALLAISAHLSAQDVFVYPQGDYTPVLHMQNVQRISFGEQGIEVQDRQGAVQSVSYEAFDYFRFYSTPVPTGIQAPQQQSHPSIFSLTGVYQGQGNTNQLPAGIYLVKQSENGRESVKKILKK